MLSKELQALIQKGMQKDTRALSELCEQKWPDILFMCIKLMGNRPDGEDAAQEVMIKLQQGLPRLKKARAFPAWLNRIITNTCTDMHRKQNRYYANFAFALAEDEYLEEDSMRIPAEYAEHKDMQTALLAALDELPYHYRAVVLMYYYEGMPVKQIALALKTSEQSVKNILARARAKLQLSIESAPGSGLQGVVAAPMVGAALTAALQAQAEKIAVLPFPASAMPAPVKPRSHKSAAVSALAATACLLLLLSVGYLAYISPAFKAYGAPSGVGAAFHMDADTAAQRAGANIQPYGQDAAAAISGRVAFVGSEETATGAQGLTVCLYIGGECKMEALVDEEGYFYFFSTPLQPGQSGTLKLQLGSPPRFAAQTDEIAIAGGGLPAEATFWVAE